MPAVFIHGVPDTYRVWSEVTKHLSRTDVVTLALPGFANDVPPGFQSTKEEYVEWIIQELERLAEPVDLVGHDWGCILVARVASIWPDLIRTWAAGGGPVSRDYEWHPLAKLLQTPGAGEEWVANFNATQFRAQLEELGLPLNASGETVDRIDERMLESILRLYRSAVHVGEEWQPGLESVIAPGLVAWGENDGGCPVRFANELARDTRAARVLKLNAGHWFPKERPAELAHALEKHWKLSQP